MRVSPTNLLLTALPPREYKRLAPHLELVSFAAKHALYPPSKAITHVYFPENAVILIVLRLKDGRTTEVGMVGNEGIVGLRALILARRHRPADERALPRARNWPVEGEERA